MDKLKQPNQLSQDNLHDVQGGPSLDDEMFKQHELLQAAKRKGMDDRSDMDRDKDINKGKHQEHNDNDNDINNDNASPEPDLNDLHPNKRIL